MTERKSGWETTAREQARKSGKRELQTLPGEWVIVQKWSVVTQEELARQRKNFNEVDGQGLPVNIEEGDLVAFHATILGGGIFDHSLTKENGGKESFADEVFIAKLIKEFPDVEDELFNLVMERNRPLARESEESSQTVPTGS